MCRREGHSRTFASRIRARENSTQLLAQSPFLTKSQKVARNELNFISEINSEMQTLPQIELCSICGKSIWLPSKPVFKNFWKSLIFKNRPRFPPMLQKIEAIFLHFAKFSLRKIREKTEGRSTVCENRRLSRNFSFAQLSRGSQVHDSLFECKIFHKNLYIFTQKYFAIFLQ